MQLEPGKGEVPDNFPLTADSGGDDYLLPKTEKSPWRDWLLLGGGCLLMAAILRFMRIGYREFTGQEFTTLDVLRGDPPSFGFAGWLMGYESLYYLVLSGWTKFAGAITETLVRLPSALFGLGAWVAFYFFARSYLRGAAFVMCILIFAINPILVSSSIDATPFAMVVLFTVLTNHFAIRAMDVGGKLNWGLYALFALLGILSHPVFFFLLFSHFVFAVLRGRRTPRVFLNLSWGLLGLCLVLGGMAVAVALGHEQRAFQFQFPSASDLVKNVTALAIGDFMRFGAEDFLRALMVLLVVACLALSYLYYHKRTAEARALPENVVWIDETLDVVGTWKQMSLRGFLVFHWMTFLVPVIAVSVAGALVPTLHLQPEYFLVALPSLIVLIAMGIDAAPRSAMPSLGLFLVLAMIFYDVSVLSDRGYGVKEAIHLVKKANYDPAKDVFLYSHPSDLHRSFNYYGADIQAIPVSSADRMRDYFLRQQRVAELVQGKERAMVFYHRDNRHVSRFGPRSPVRDWFSDARNSFDPAEDGRWMNLSEAEKTELIIYQRRSQTASTSEGIPPAAPPPSPAEIEAISARETTAPTPAAATPTP